MCRIQLTELEIHMAIQQYTVIAGNEKLDGFLRYAFNQDPPAMNPADPVFQGYLEAQDMDQSALVSTLRLLINYGAITVTAEDAP